MKIISSSLSGNPSSSNPKRMGGRETASVSLLHELFPLILSLLDRDARDLGEALGADPRLARLPVQGALSLGLWLSGRADHGVGYPQCSCTILFYTGSLGP